jgi:hypothetical protein
MACLVLLLACSTANARPSSPRGNRATGITLTAMGIVNLALVVVLVPAAYKADSEGTTGALIGGAGAAGAVGAALLSVGIPFWVLGQRDLDRQRSVSLAPTGLRIQF